MCSACGKYLAISPEGLCNICDEKALKKRKKQEDQQAKDTLLLAAWNYCDEEDKSDAFMLQYMQDVAGVDLDYVLDFLDRYEGKRH